MQKLFKTLALATLFCAVPLAASAYDIIIDGEKLVATDAYGTPVESFMEDGTTYVPVRALAQAFGTEISWDQETMTVFIGEARGESVLNDYVSIFYDGAEFTAKNALGEVVRPILSDGTTYLPIRAIGELFGKKVSWDMVSQSVMIASQCPSDALAYLKKAMTDTASRADLTVLSTFNGTLSYEGAEISSHNESVIEPYNNQGFLLENFLPEDFYQYVSYMGEGKFFINPPSEKFSQSEDILRALSPTDVSPVFSTLAVTVETKGGYITSVIISGCGSVDLNEHIFRIDFSLAANLMYPQEFAFPLIPYPDNSIAESMSSALGEAADAEDIIKRYMSALFAQDSSQILGLLTETDYKALFAEKSNAQISLEISLANRRLEENYSLSDGEFSLDSMEYLDTASYSSAPDAAIKVNVSTVIKDGDDSYAEEISFVILRYGDNWYVDRSALETFIK